MNEKEFVLVSQGIEIMRTNSQEKAVNYVKKENDDWFDYKQKCIDNYEQYADNYIDLEIEYASEKQKDKEIMISFAKQFKDSLTRNNKFGHFTASAFVVNENFNKVLLVHHNIFDGYIFPGGHADDVSDFLSVAVKEVKEETNIFMKSLQENLWTWNKVKKKNVKAGTFLLCGSICTV